MITVVETTAAATRPLRLAVLRPGLPPDSLVDLPGATHLAALDGDDIVGAAVLVPRPFALRPDAVAWQLRGMAVDPGRQHAGIGGRLLDTATTLARRAGIELLWCHARTTARGFYERHGWRAEGDEFIGSIDLPHYLMWRPAGGTEPIADPTSSNRM